MKGNYETVGVSAEVAVGDCAAQQVHKKIQIQQHMYGKYKYSRPSMEIPNGTEWNIEVIISVRQDECQVPENRVSSLLAWAQAEGKATGIVTTDRLKKVKQM